MAVSLFFAFTALTALLSRTSEEAACAVTSPFAFAFAFAFALPFALTLLV